MSAATTDSSWPPSLRSMSLRNGMEWNGMEWSGMEWNGVEWNGVEWSGMEWNYETSKKLRVQGICICSHAEEV